MLKDPTKDKPLGYFFHMHELRCSLIWTIFYYKLTSLLPHLRTFCSGWSEPVFCELTMVLYKLRSHILCCCYPLVSTVEWSDNASKHFCFKITLFSALVHMRMLSFLCAFLYLMTKFACCTVNSFEVSQQRGDRLAALPCLGRPLPVIMKLVQLDVISCKLDSDNICHILQQSPLSSSCKARFTPCVAIGNWWRITLSFALTKAPLHSHLALCACISEPCVKLDPDIFQTSSKTVVCVCVCVC